MCLRPEDAGISPAVCVRCLYTGTGSPLGCMRTGGGGAFALHFSCTVGACAGVGLRPAGRRARGVCCTRGGACLRVCVGCAAGAGQVRVGGGCAVQEGVCLQSRIGIAKVREDGTVVFTGRSYLNFRHFTVQSYLNFRNKIYRTLFPRNIKLRSKNWFNVKRGRFLGRGFLRCRRVYRAGTVR